MIPQAGHSRCWRTEQCRTADPKKRPCTRRGADACRSSEPRRWWACSIRSVNRRCPGTETRWDRWRLRHARRGYLSGPLEHRAVIDPLPQSLMGRNPVGLDQKNSRGTSWDRRRIRDSGRLRPARKRLLASGDWERRFKPKKLDLTCWVSLKSRVFDLIHEQFKSPVYDLNQEIWVIHESFDLNYVWFKSHVFWFKLLRWFKSHLYDLNQVWVKSKVFDLSHES